MKSSDRVALSLSACEAVDRQDPETEEGKGGREGRTDNHSEGRQVYSRFLFSVVFLKLYDVEDS